MQATMGTRARGLFTPPRVAAMIVWGAGAFMTAAALDQMTDWDAGALFAAAILLQAALTFGQGPVWRGRGSLISYTLLIIDAVINFGGVMAIMANVDQMGSVQAMGATFLNYGGPWPTPAKGALALFFAALVAGLPEFLWNME